ENQMFDLVLDVVVELVTVGPEKFDAVVVIRIVGGGDHNAGVGAQAARDVGDSGGGQRANEQNIHPHRKDAGRDGIFEHVTGQTRVFAENNLVPLAVARLRRNVLEDVAGRAAQLERGLGGRRLDVGGAAHSVGAENFLRLAHGSIRIPVIVGGVGRRNPFHGDFFGLHLR